MAKVLLGVYLDEIGSDQLGEVTATSSLVQRRQHRHPPIDKLSTKAFLVSSMVAGGTSPIFQWQVSTNGASWNNASGIRRRQSDLSDFDDNRQQWQ